MLRNFQLWLLLSVVPVGLFAQLQHPSQIKWTEIKTPHFRVIAPNKIEAKALQTANQLEHIYKPVSSSLHYSKKRLPVLLINESVVSNGFVTIGPTYSAFYITPMQDANLLGGGDWLQNLTLHEYRHYVQFNKLNDNFTRFSKGLLGDMGQALCMNVSTPLWALEGDAICIETALSGGGRGRLPAFNRAIRANEMEGIRYAYDKAYLGSYKHYIPNHYYLGYILSSGIKANYGLKNWDWIMSKSSRYSFWPYSFTRSIRHSTGKKFKHNYHDILNEYVSIWTEKAAEQTTTAISRHHIPKKVYTHYTYPFKTQSGEIVCLKYGIADVPELCLIGDGGETILEQINPRERFHSNGRQVVWSVTTSDIRWGERSYADVTLFDLETHEKRKITKKQKYFAPAISPGGKRIAAVEYNELMECSLVILDAQSGDKLAGYIMPSNSFIRMPSWSADEKRIVFTQTMGQEVSLVIFNLEIGGVETSVPFGNEVITSPSFYGNYVLYNSMYMGVDAVYAFQPKIGDHYLVAASKYGVYNASYTCDMLYMQDYTTKGFTIASSALDTTSWKAKGELVNVFDNYYEKLVEQEGQGNIFADSIQDQSSTYQVKNYRPLLKSINIHSWVPSPIYNGVQFAVLSNDFLNTTSAMAGFDYYKLDHATRQFIDIDYARFYPVLNITASNGRNYGTEINPDDLNAVYAFREQVLGVGVKVPINLSGETNSSTLNINMGYNYIKQKYDTLFIGNNGLLEFTAFNAGFNYSNYRMSSMRDLYPRYGQEIRTAVWRSPGSNNFFATEGKVYFPGLLKHHSLRIKAGYEYSSNYFNRGIYTIPTQIEFVRGYLHKVNANEKYNGTLMYSMPLLYPDLRIGPVMYIKRIHTSLFADYGMADIYTGWETYFSVGLDLNFEFNLCRILPIPFEVGVRGSYLPLINTISIEPLVFRMAF